MNEDQIKAKLDSDTDLAPATPQQTSQSIGMKTVAPQQTSQSIGMKTVSPANANKMLPIVQPAQSTGGETKPKFKKILVTKAQYRAMVAQMNAEKEQAAASAGIQKPSPATGATVVRPALPTSVQLQRSAGPGARQDGAAMGARVVRVAGNFIQKSHSSGNMNAPGQNNRPGLLGSAPNVLQARRIVQSPRGEIAGLQRV